MNDELTGRDLYLKVTDKHGKSHVSHHRVWNAELCFAAQTTEHVKHGGKVALASLEDYRKQREPRA